MPEPAMSPSWNPQRVLQRARKVLRQEGLKSLWFKLLGELFYRRVVVFVRELDETPAVISTRIPVELGILRAGEIHEYLALRPEADPDDIRQRLTAGQRCFVARAEGRLVHVSWLTTGRAWIAYLSREIQLGPDEVYSYESLTAPDFRGSNVSAARSVYMQQTLRRTGYRRSVTVVMPENRPAFRSVAKAGYRRVGMLRTIWLGRWRRDFGRLVADRSIGSAYWDGVASRARDRSHYLDPYPG